MITEAQVRATNKYRAKAYDRLEILVPRGEKQHWKDYAASRGESLNSLIRRLLLADSASAGFPAPPPSLYTPAPKPASAASQAAADGPQP